MSTSRKETDFWGNEITVHYDDDGDKIGTTRTEEPGLFEMLAHGLKRVLRHSGHRGTEFHHPANLPKRTQRASNPTSDGTSETGSSPTPGTLDDQTELNRKAKHDRNANVRLAATRNLNDQTTLRDLAKHDRNANVRLAAKAKLNTD